MVICKPGTKTQRVFLALFCFLAIHGYSQQIADSLYSPRIDSPTYPLQNGPLILIDEGHNNFHTLTGRYKPFGSLLEKDGYQLGPLKGEITSWKLEHCRVLVISNPLHESNLGKWYLPTPSAFTAEELNIIENWVKQGGSLFLIADHMPFAGAASDLAKKFGFDFYNGFAMSQQNKPSIFDLKNQTLKENSITLGHGDDEAVKKVVTFTGQAFTIPTDADPILEFDNNHTLYLPDTSWVFDDKTKTMEANGLYQMAYKIYGKGKLVVSGEAAMFSAQLAGPQHLKMGMNNSLADENYKLLLNSIRWLDGKLQ